MLLIAIATAEILFWVLLVAGLLVRYALKAPRIGAGLLLATPVVDLALLILTYIDLSTGRSSNFLHGLSAIYIGYSTALGPTIIKSLDKKIAKRFGRPVNADADESAHQTALSTWRRTCLASLISLILLGLGIIVAGIQGSFWLIYWAIVAVFIPAMWWFIGPRRAKKAEARRRAGDPSFRAVNPAVAD